MSKWIIKIRRAKTAEDIVTKLRNELREIEIGIDQPVVDMVHKAVNAVGADGSKVLVWLLKTREYSLAYLAISVLINQGIKRIHYSDLHPLVASVINKSDFIHVTKQLLYIKTHKKIDLINTSAQDAAKQKHIIELRTLQVLDYSTIDNVCRAIADTRIDDKIFAKNTNYRWTKLIYLCRHITPSGKRIPMGTQRWLSRRTNRG